MTSEIRANKYYVYKPAGGDALVMSGRATIYFHYAKEALYAAMSAFLVSATWVSGGSWINDTSEAQSRTHSSTTELRVTQAKELTNSVDVAAAFEGLTISIDSSKKTFSPAETTSTGTETITVNVPPRTRVTLYQRVYEFRVPMFFILDAWSKEWNIGSPGGGNIMWKECTVQITGNDYLTTEVDMVDGVGCMTVATVARAVDEHGRNTRTCENVTQWAKDELVKMGVRGI